MDIVAQPNQPMISPLDELPAGKRRDGEIGRDSLDDKSRQMQDRKEALGDAPELDSTRLQEAMNWRQRSAEPVEKISRRSNQSSSGIVNNLK